MDLNYQQVLAEVYEENAKNVLVHQPEYDDEDKPAYEEYDYDDNDLPDKEEFNKFAGDRNKPEHIIKPSKKSDGLELLSSKKDTIFRMSILNIDGQFRSNQIPRNVQTNNCQGNIIPSELSLAPESVQSGTNFAFRTARQYKNVYSVEVTSIEFPNSFYSFSSDRGNTTFTIIYLGTSYSILIPDGNYQNIVNTISGTPYLPADPLATPPILPGTIPDTTTLLGAIQQVILYTPGLGTFSQDDGYYVSDIILNYVPTLHLVYFLLNGNGTLQITFPSVETNCYGNGIGYNLGFIQQSYTATSQTIPGSIPNNHLPPNGFSPLCIVGDTFPDILQDNYVYLKLSDWDQITHQNPNQTSFTAFLKIPLTVPKFTVQFDNNTANTTTKKYFFHQPTNINLIQISMLDAYGNVLDLQYGSFSLTLQIQEVLSTSAYQGLLEY
jgi:hypothetical protein